MSVPPKELSLFEIRRFMLDNNCRVTNHALVKHFKKFLTNTETANEARKKLKTYANILATIKVEDNQKFLILRKKYLHECPTEDEENKTVEVPPSPGGNDSVDAFNSPFRQPPPYKEPPKPHQDRQTTENYRDCVNEFAAAVRQIDPNRMAEVETATPVPPALPPKNKPISRQSSVNDEDKENISISSGFTVSSGAAVTPVTTTDSEKSSAENNGVNENSDVENPISVKEATRKFNRMASQEESKILSPPNKKKVEKQMEDKISIDVTMTHPKAKEWIVTAAKADYQELAKLSSEYPELVKLQDPATGYTALHWASKHGKEDVVKLIAGTHKANVNAKTNGGYTPLHLAMQFGRDNIFDLLCNVYKANRDIMDYSGMKPLDYRKQRTCVSESTYSSEYYLPFVVSPMHQITTAAGGTINLQRKKQSRPRYATTIISQSLQRTSSLMVSSKRGRQSLFNAKGECDLFPGEEYISDSSSIDSLKFNNNNNNIDVADGDSLSPLGSKKKLEKKATRKESFLRRKFISPAKTDKKLKEIPTNID